VDGILQDNVNKCCGDQAQKNTRGEMLLKLNQRSLSHSSHTHSQSRSQNAMVLTDITATVVSNHNHHHNNTNATQSVQNHHLHRHCHHHVSGGPNLHYKYGDFCEAVDIWGWMMTSRLQVLQKHKNQFGRRHIIIYMCIYSIAENVM